MSKRIWVWIEFAHEMPSPLSLELLTPARTQGSAEAIVLGPATEQALATVGSHGAAVIHHGADAAYAEFVAGPQVATLAALIAAEHPDLILFPSTFNARDVCARLAAHLNVGVVANASGLDLDGDALKVTVPYAGDTLATVTVDGSPALVQVRAKAFTAEATGGSADVRQASIPVDPASCRVKIVEHVDQESEGPNLEDAKTIVAGGRGLGKAENFGLLDALAKQLGGAVGASRAVVDAGWVPYTYQVGQTGRTVKPDVYVACGISGAVQHVAGMRGSKYIIAINQDADAPIFGLADLGVVGNVLTIVPALTQRLQTG